MIHEIWCQPLSFFFKLCVYSSLEIINKLMYKMERWSGCMFSKWCLHCLYPRGTRLHINYKCKFSPDIYHQNICFKRLTLDCIWFERIAFHEWIYDLDFRILQFRKWLEKNLRCWWNRLKFIIREGFHIPFRVEIESCKLCKISFGF